MILPVVNVVATGKFTGGSLAGGIIIYSRVPGNKTYQHVVVLFNPKNCGSTNLLGVQLQLD